MTYRIIRLATIFSALGVAAACATAPPLPEQTAGDTPAYRSTADEASAGAEPGGEEAGEVTKPRGTGGVPTAVGPVASVNGEEIGPEVFNTEIQRIAASGQFPEEVLPQFTDAIVNSVVSKYLIDRAIDEADVTVSAEQVAARVETMREDYRASAEAAGREEVSLEEQLEMMGTSQAEFEESVADSLRIEAVLEARGVDMPGPEQARSFYEENEDRFARPEEVRARHILIQVDASATDAQWEEGFERIQVVRASAVAEGADFAELAREHSEGPSASRGGDLGYFSRGRMVPAFESVVFEMDKGEVSEPVKTQFGWHLIELVDRREAGVVSFEEVREQLVRALKEQTVQAEVQTLVAELREGAEIELYLDNIQ